jgi:hypothetical protein
MRITIDLDNIEEKALLTDVLDIEEWVTNAVREKVRRVIDQRAEEALGAGSAAIAPLEPEQRAELARSLATLGVVAPNVKHMPPEVKRDIIALAATTTVAQRNEAVESEN